MEYGRISSYQQNVLVVAVVSYTSHDNTERHYMNHNQHQDVSVRCTNAM
jgi:hypothetical protein